MVIIRRRLQWLLGLGHVGLFTASDHSRTYYDQFEVYSERECIPQQWQDRLKFNVRYFRVK